MPEFERNLYTPFRTSMSGKVFGNDICRPNIVLVWFGCVSFLVLSSKLTKPQVIYRETLMSHLNAEKMLEVSTL